MRVAYLDCFSGISGDMFLAALIDAGAPVRRIKLGLAALRLPPWRLKVLKVKRGGISGTQIQVRALRAMRDGISTFIRRAKGSRLPQDVKEKAEKVIKRLLAAEGRVHGVAARNVHLHEIENLDTLVDVYGSILALNLLNVARVYSSAAQMGSGRIRTSHGRLPVPAPGTAELLKGREIILGGPGGELTTPTGAALLSGLCSEGLPPVLALSGIGYGAGAREESGTINMLRVMLGDTGKGPETERICQIECVIDDMNPQLVEAFLERAYTAGAKEAWTFNVNMKKQRPGVALVALADEAKLGSLIQAFFEETGTLGIRITRPERICLPRRIIRIRTKWGRIRVKLAGEGREFHAIPEYEDIKGLARRAGRPVRLVMEQVKGIMGRAKGGGGPI